MKDNSFREFVTEVKRLVSITEVIGRHVSLNGNKGLCPFHEDKHPSLVVYPVDQHFHCYGCGAHGDVITFLQRIEGKPFREVLNQLAQEVGLKQPDFSTTKEQHKA